FTPKQLAFVVMAFLVVFSALSGGLYYIQAAGQPIKLTAPPAKITLKDLLNMPKGVHQWITPGGKSQKLPYWPHAPLEDTKNLKPSAEPAKMKPVTVTISGNKCGQATPTPTPGTTATQCGTPTTAAPQTPGTTQTPAPTPRPSP